MAQTNDTIDGLLAEFRGYSAGMPASYHVTMSWADFRRMLDRLDAAHKREVEALKQRINELNAEVAAKDEVIKRLNDAITEEQRRKMATAENPSAVGDCAKLRKTLETVRKYVKEITPDKVLLGVIEIWCDEALAAPPRNCDRFGGDNAKLQKVYYSECGKEYDPKDPISRQTYLVGYGNWLLAPATKGGNNGNE